MGPDRLPPLPDGSLSLAQQRAATELATGPRGAVFGPFVPLLRSPDLLSPLQKAGEYLRYKSAFPPRLSEFAILIVARRWNQQYEWHVHQPIAERSGVPAGHIRAVAEGRRPDDMAPDQAVVHDFLHELQSNLGVSDTTYGRAVELFGERGVIDLCGICGYYTTLAMVMNVARTALPDGVDPPLAT
ncbi:MAG TPA: carboxymuconolactone decarboxylase family protein [Usitatibacteraceae bacterium]|nr:carboxymuconolactone decarboxylase family protein [Usitatibacteraceae bacterium]HRA23230.1 carboxymuconolactone decarboxylase family protein [Usitatibacteraceae bacterium]